MKAFLLCYTFQGGAGHCFMYSDSLTPKTICEAVEKVEAENGFKIALSNIIPLDS